MKRNYIILWAILTTIVTACRNNAQPAAVEESTSNNKEYFDTLQIKEHFLLDTLDANSPALDINIKLLVPGNVAPTIADNMNSCISYAAFGYEGISAAVAADSIVNSMKREYLELRDEYINEKTAAPDAPWFNTYYILNSKAGVGRDGCICYEVDYETYNGGAHPSNIISCINMDAKSGKEITLQDVFADGTEEVLTERLTERLAQQNGVKGIAGLQEIDYLIFSDMYITNNFILGKDSIYFLYNNYEIAPYYKGRSRLGFKYDELKDLLK